MDDTIYLVSRLVMRRRPRRFETSTLIDRDIDQNGTWMHPGKHAARDQTPRAGPWNENRADDDISISNFILNRLQRRETGPHTTCKGFV